MPQLPVFYEPFKEELKYGPLSGEDLIKRVQEKKNHYFPVNKKGCPINKKYPVNEKKVYTRALTRLLEEKVIQVDKYVGKNAQSLDAKDFVYSLIIKEPTEILNLLKKVEYGDLKAKKDLKSVFDKRIKEVEKIREKYWHFMMYNSVERPLIKDEMLFLEDNNGKIEYNLCRNDLKKLNYSKVNGVKMSKLSTFMDETEIPKILDKYSGAKVWIFKQEYIEKLSFNGKTIDVVLLDKHFFKDEVTIEKCLKLFNIYPPRNMDEKYLANLLEDIILYIISSREYDMSSLMVKFSKALSEGKGANNLLEEIIREATHGKEHL